MPIDTKFTPEFQEAILACLVVVPDEFNWAQIREVAGVLTKSQHITIAYRLADYLDKHKEPPTWTALREKTIRYVSRHSTGVDEEADINAAFERLQQIDTAKELRLVKLSLEKWQRQTALDKRISEYLDAQDKGTDEERQEAFKALSMSVSNMECLGTRKYEVYTLTSILDMEFPPDTCLLGDDFLLRTEGMLYIGPSGAGKSTSSLFQDIHWAAGRSAFGMKPVQPLKVMHIQSEDSLKKIQQRMLDIITDVNSGTEPFTEKELELIEQNLKLICCIDLAGDIFIGQLRQWVREHRPDIIRINPTFSYVGANLADAEKVTNFLRIQINPILTRFNCSCILVCHPTKPRKEGQGDMRISDYAYTAFGSVEFSNWARSIMAFEATDVRGSWHFVASKPGPALEWKDEIGKPIAENYYKWWNGSWRELDDDDRRELEEAKATKHNGHARPGRKNDHDDDLMLAPLCNGEGVKDRQDLVAKLKSKFGDRAPSPATVYRRWSRWVETGLIEQNGDKNWVRISSHNGLRELSQCGN